MTRLRITDQMLGGIETPRLNVTRGSHASLRGRGSTHKTHAHASRHRPAVARYVVGA